MWHVGLKAKGIEANVGQEFVMKIGKMLQPLFYYKAFQHEKNIPKYISTIHHLWKIIIRFQTGTIKTLEIINT